MKTCRECGVELSVETNWNKSMKKYGNYQCKSCRKGYRERNKESHKKYLEENKDSIRETRKRYDEKNRGHLTFLERTRKARVRNQTPDMNVAQWAEIDAMYLYNQIMPGKWHVDHIDPIDNGGLHHPENLQILSEHDNCSKGHRV